MEKGICAIVLVKLKRIYSGIVCFGQRLEYDYCWSWRILIAAVIVQLCVCVVGAAYAESIKCFEFRWCNEAKIKLFASVI